MLVEFFFSALLLSPPFWQTAQLNVYFPPKPHSFSVSTSQLQILWQFWLMNLFFNYRIFMILYYLKFYLIFDLNLNFKILYHRIRFLVRKIKSIFLCSKCRNIIRNLRAILLPWRWCNILILLCLRFWNILSNHCNLYSGHLYNCNV